MAQVNARGNVLGLWETLGKALRRLTGTYGPCVLSSECVTVVEIPNLLSYMMANSAESPVAPIASSVTLLAYTTPADERWELNHLRVERQTGDNTMTELAVRLPAGYGVNPAGNAREIVLAGLTTPAASIRWPTPYLPTGYTYVIAPQRILLEPGSIILLGLAGVGTAASTFVVYISALVTKVVRASVP